MMLEKIYNSLLKCSGGVSTDTRKIKENSLFIALKGENFDANEFVIEALNKGASFAVSDKDNTEFDSYRDRIFVVSDTLKLLQDLANLHRRKSTAHLLAITGSNGKTTSKELLRNVLKTKFKVHSTPGNFNNHIGLPLTLLGIQANTEIAIVEMGDNKLGDISELCQISEPDSVIVTNIGKDHIGGFGSFENNVKSKMELLDYAINHDKMIFIDAKENEIAAYVSSHSNKVLLQDLIQIELIDSVDAFVGYKAKNQNYTTQLIGSYNIQNIQIACGVGLYFNVEIVDIHGAICEYRPENNRSQHVKTSNNEIILDAYNANPSSVALAISSFAKIKTENNKAIILGDMLELGDVSEEEHLAIHQSLAHVDAQVFYIGEMYFNTLPKSSNVFRNKSDFEVFLNKKPFTDKLILIKGSRSLKLETLIEKL